MRCAFVLGHRKTKSASNMHSTRNFPEKKSSISPRFKMMKKRCNKIPVLSRQDNLAPHEVLDSSSFGARDVNYLFFGGKRQETVNGLNREHVLNGHLQRLSSGHSSLGFATFQALNPSFAQEDDEKYRFKA